MKVRKGLRGGSVRIVPVYDLKQRLEQIREQLAVSVALRRCYQSHLATRLHGLGQL